MGPSRRKELVQHPGGGVQESMGSQGLRFRREVEGRERDVGMIHTLAPEQGFLLESQLLPPPYPVSPLSDVRNPCIFWSPQEVPGLVKAYPQVSFQALSTEPEHLLVGRGEQTPPRVRGEYL